MPRTIERYDDANEYDWAYTLTTYAKGRVAEVYTLYDDGSEGWATYDAGTLVSELRRDDPADPSTNPWTEIRTTFDASGAPATIDTLLDDGSTRTESYSGGILASSLEIDASDANDWARIESTFDVGGIIVSRMTLNDDGSTLEESFANGVIVSSVTLDNPAGSTAAWQRIDRTFDETGQVLQQSTLFDDGTLLEERFADGVLEFSRAYDDPATNAEDWGEIVSLFDATGAMTRQETTYDTGVVEVASYSGGILARTVTYDSPIASTAPWQQIDRIFDAAGVLEREVTLFDNGVTQTTQYAGGTITYQVQQDDPSLNAEDWEVIESLYDSAGQLERQTTYLDNGVTDETHYQGGTIAYRLQIDDPYTNAEAWEAIESVYGYGGQLERETTFYDNGVIDETHYRGGTIAYRLQRDDPYTDAEEWEAIESVYGYGGQLERETTYYDNGVTDESHYQGGTITYRLQRDDPYTNAEEWEAIESIYGHDGQLERETTFYDNGVIDETHYQGGFIDYRLQQDDPYTNAEAWEAIETIYGYGGQIEQETTFYDTGVVDEFHFYNGTLWSRVQTDGPGNAEDWQRIETNYDGYGDPSSVFTLYDDGREAVSHYEWGNLVSETIYDDPYGPNLYDWSHKAFEYQDGFLFLSATLYDDGDYERDDFDGSGVLATHWDYDGDGDEAWLGRRIDYAPDGTEFATTLWFEGDTLPPELSGTDYVLY